VRSVTEHFHDDSLSMLLNNVACSKRNRVQEDYTREFSPVHSCSSSTEEEQSIPLHPLPSVTETVAEKRRHRVPDSATEDEKYIPLHPLPSVSETIMEKRCHRILVSASEDEKYTHLRPQEKRRYRIPDLTARRQSSTSDDAQSFCSKSSMPSLASFNSESMRSRKSLVSANSSSMENSDDSFSSLVTADSSVCSFAHSVVSALSTKSTHKSPAKNKRIVSRFVGDLKVRNVSVPPNDLVAGRTLDCIESVAIKPRREEEKEKRLQRWGGTSPRSDMLPRMVRTGPNHSRESRGNPEFSTRDSPRDVVPHVARRRTSTSDSGSLLAAVAALNVASEK
jgi:hypothetical protein